MPDPGTFGERQAGDCSSLNGLPWSAKRVPARRVGHGAFRLAQCRLLDASLNGFNTGLQQQQTQSIMQHYGHWASSFCEPMLAIVRASFPELARGISTSLALFAGSNKCPDCQCSPVLNCPDIPAAPDCVCQGTTRLCPVTEPLLTVDRLIASHTFVLLLGICLGLYLRHSCPRRASESLNRSSSTEHCPTDDTLQFPGISSITVSPASLALSRLRKQK